VTPSENRICVEQLPLDYFGVLVENDMDERRLLWLVNEIGETELRSSVRKYNARYPDCKPFVSLILKWYCKTVPVRVYAPVSKPVYSVYVLVTKDGSAIKVGHSGRWHDRARDFLCRDKTLPDLFDLTKSCATVIGGSKKGAAAVETKVKHRFREFSTASPKERNLIPYGCGGHGEWFIQDCYQDVIEYLVSETKHRPDAAIRTLQSALEGQAVFDSVSKGVLH
jgi:hypothetical protein